MCSLPRRPESHFSFNASNVLEATDPAAVKDTKQSSVPTCCCSSHENADSSSQHSSKCASHPCPLKLHHLPGAASASICPLSEWEPSQMPMGRMARSSPWSLQPQPLLETSSKEAASWLSLKAPGSNHPRGCCCSTPGDVRSRPCWPRVPAPSSHVWVRTAA